MYPKPIALFILICDWAGKLGLIIVTILSLVGILPAILLAIPLLFYIPNIWDFKNQFPHKRKVFKLQNRKQQLLLLK